MPVPIFSVNEVLTSSAMNVSGSWRINTCTVTSAGGTAATASNGVISIGSNNTSVTVSNAFSSSYENYRIVLTLNSGSVDAAFFLRLSGSNTAYYYSNLQNTFAGSNVTDKAENATGWRIGSNDSTNGTYAIIDLLRPQLTQMSFMSFTGIYGDVGGAYWIGGGIHNSTSSFTGFEIYPNSGNFSGGSIRVYGYNK